MGGVLRNGDAARSGAAPAQRVVRGGGGREPARSGAAAPGRVDRVRLHVGHARALLRAARPGPGRSVGGEQSALRPRALHERGRYRYGGGGRDPRRRAAAPDRAAHDLQRAHPSLFRASGAHRHARAAADCYRGAAGSRRRDLGAIRRAIGALGAEPSVREARFLAFGCPHVIAAAGLGCGAGRGRQPRAPLAAKRAAACASASRPRWRSWAACSWWRTPGSPRCGLRCRHWDGRVFDTHSAPFSYQKSALLVPCAGSWRVLCTSCYQPGARRGEDTATWRYC